MFVTSKDYGDFVADFSKRDNNDLGVTMMTAYENMVRCSNHDFDYFDNAQKYASEVTERMKTQVEALLEVAQKRLKEKGIEIPKVEETSYLFKNRLGKFPTWVQEEAKLFATMKAFRSLEPSAATDSEIDRIEQWRMGKNFVTKPRIGSALAETPFWNHSLYRNYGEAFMDSDGFLYGSLVNSEEMRQMKKSLLPLEGANLRLPPAETNLKNIKLIKRGRE